MIKIYHNPRCSKSREALNIINEHNAKVEIVEYLNEQPSEQELIEVLKKLGMNASEIIRKGEPVYQDKFKGKSLSDDEWIQAMIQFPKLIERPIVIKGDKAVLGRPPENVLELLK